jgi:hypothetical protein
MTTREDALAALDGLDTIKPRALLEDYLLPILDEELEARDEAIIEQIDAISSAQAFDELAQEGHACALSWAAIALKMGEEAGWFVDGKPTDAIPAAVQAAYLKAKKGHVGYEERYQEVYDEDAATAGPDDDDEDDDDGDGDEGDEKAASA